MAGAGLAAGAAEVVTAGGLVALASFVAFVWGGFEVSGLGGSVEAAELAAVVG